MYFPSIVKYGRNGGVVATVVHSCAIVIYEDGPLDQLIGPIEIIFLPLPPSPPPPGRGKVLRARASARSKLWKKRGSD